MRVLSQEEIDAMLAKMLANPSILPNASEDNEEKDENIKQEAINAN